MVDAQAMDQIVSAAQLAPDDTVMEIGTGLATLTEKLAARAGRVITFEIDPRLRLIAASPLAHLPNVTLVPEDFLRANLAHYLKGLKRTLQPYKIVSNLPYNITSPVLEKLYESKAPSPVLTVMTIQKEVADRLTAAPDTSEYGGLTVILGALTDIKIVATIGPTSFKPQPGVTSTTIAIRQKEKPIVPPKEFPLFRSIVRSAFHQRRKMLSNALRSVGELTRRPGKLEKGAQKAGIDLTRRAETLSIQEFAALAHALYSPR